MRTTNFARAICAIAVFGLAINSACAPDKKKTPIKNAGGGGGGGGAGAGGEITNRAAVTSDAGRCSANAESRELSQLQPKIDKLSQPGTPIELPQLPQGQYRLTNTIANLQYKGASISGGSDAFDVYRESSVMIADKEAKDSCADFAFAGQPPAGFSDLGRNFPIDSYFEVNANHKVGRVDASNFHFILSKDSAKLSDIGVDGIPDSEMAQNQANEQQRLAALTPAARKQALMAQAKQKAESANLPTPMRLFSRGVAKEQIGNPKQNNPNATSTAQIYKLSEVEYAVVISFNENQATTRKVMLVYGFASNTATAQAGTMTTPGFKTSPSAPVAPKATDTTTNAAPPVNQQPSGNQQDQDAEAAKAAPAAPPAPPADNSNPLTQEQ